MKKEVNYIISFVSSQRATKENGFSDYFFKKACRFLEEGNCVTSCFCSGDDIESAPIVFIFLKSNKEMERKFIPGDQLFTLQEGKF